MAGPTARTQSSKHHIFLMTIFILAIIALLIQDDLIHTVSGYFRSGDPSKYASLTGSSTFKGLNPDMYSPTEKGRKMTFRTIPELEDLSHAGDDHWYGEISSANDSHWIHVLTAEDYDYYTTRHPPLIMTHGAGMLNVKYNETLAVPFGITMFHALHCLGSIRSALQDAMGKEHKDHGKEERDGHHDALISDMHVGHCFAYIAQTLLCNADTTIEPPWKVHDDAGNIVRYGVDGRGVTHQCRDISQMWNMTVSSEKEARESWEWAMGQKIEDLGDY